MPLSRRDLLALSGLTLARATLAPTATRAQTPKRGGTLSVRVWDPPHWDPMLTVSYKTHVALSFTHGRLLKHRAGPGVQPGTFPIEGDLAESWTQPNETTYVFKLRRGVRWHPKPPVNGRELTADDVVYSVDRFLTVKGNANAYMLRAVDKVEALDRHTVRFTLKEPFAWFLDMLANPLAVAIVAKECVEKFGDLRSTPPRACAPPRSVRPARAVGSPGKLRWSERRWLALLAFVLLALPAAPLSAAERIATHSRDRGGARARADLVVPRDAPTIQAAIDAAEDGGSIFVLPGVYREALRIVGKRLRVSGGGRAILLGEPPRTVDPAERAVGLVTYLEGGGGVFEGFELRGGPNGIVGQPPGGSPGGEVPVPEARADALTIRDVQITNSGRGILWRAGSDLLVENTRIRNMLHHGVVFKPIAPGPSVKLIDVAVALLAGWGYLIFDTPSIGCQNQLVNPGALGAQQGGIGVFRSGVCIFGGVLLANQRAGIYFQQSAAIVDGTQILETAPPNGVGILAFGSELQQIVNAELDGNDEIGIQLVGSTAVLGWDTLNCHGIHLAGNTLPAGHLGPNQPPADVPPFVEPLFGNDGGVWCGCGEAQQSCDMMGGASVPAAATPAE